MKILIATKNTHGLGDFIKKIAQTDTEIFATSDSSAALTEAGIEFVEASDLAHSKCDLLVANLFAEDADVANLEDVSLAVPGLIRRAAANWKNQLVITTSCLYNSLAEALAQGDVSEELRKKLAVYALRHIADYDTRLDTKLSKELLGENVLHMKYTRGEELRYGENSHQNAVFYKDHSHKESSLANAEQLHGKELSYNNIVDADAALEMVREFSGRPAVAIIKHLNPCGLATGESLEEAFEAAWDGDPVSAFGSVIACSQKVDLATAERLKGRFVEILLAPGFDEDAVEILKKRSKNLRILNISEVNAAQSGLVYKHVIGGMLVQDRDILDYEKWECVTEAPFPSNKDALARFTWLVTKHTKSNAIVMCQEYKDGCFKIVGLGPGQPNRIDSNLRLCQPRVRDNVARMELADGQSREDLEQEVFAEVVMGSDAFFPFADNIEAAHDAGVRYIVQPGGSIRDEEVIQRCNDLGVAMIFTGTRHFRH